VNETKINKKQLFFNNKVQKKNQFKANALTIKNMNQIYHSLFSINNFYFLNLHNNVPKL
jgi:hypothetical protein